MAFLSKKLMAKSEKASSKETHPLLKGREVSQNVRLAYLQGCVLATLLDDAQVSADERRQIEELGRTLDVDDVEIAKSLEVVQGLQSDEDQDAFLKELKAALGEKDVIALFMADFERLMQKPKGMSAEAREGLDFIGGELVGSANWRSVLASLKEEQAMASPSQAAVDVKRKKSDVRGKSAAFREKAMEFIVTLKQGGSGDWEKVKKWTGMEAVRRLRSAVRDHVSTLDQVDVEVEEVWNYHLSVIKRKYIEERPEQRMNFWFTYTSDHFDLNMYFESIWFLAYLSFAKSIGKDSYDDAIKLSDLEWLSDDMIKFRAEIGREPRKDNEKFIWKLLKVASKTIDSKEPEETTESCEGWWDE